MDTVLFAIVEAVDEARNLYRRDPTPANAQLWALAVEVLVSARRERNLARLSLVRPC